jgi:hypothetical protein
MNCFLQFRVSFLIAVSVPLGSRTAADVEVAKALKAVTEPPLMIYMIYVIIMIYKRFSPCSQAGCARRGAAAGGYV